MKSHFVKYVKCFATTAVVATVAGAAALAAQTPQDAPAFEVASIKPNNSGDGRVMMQNQPGRFIATNVTLRVLIRQAYQLQDFQISGGPGWLDSDHFDINAKVPDGVRRHRPPAARRRSEPAAADDPRRCSPTGSSSSSTTRRRTRRSTRWSSRRATASSGRS